MENYFKIDGEWHEIKIKAMTVAFEEVNIKEYGIFINQQCL